MDKNAYTLSALGKAPNNKEKLLETPVGRLLATIAIKQRLNETILLAGPVLSSKLLVDLEKLEEISLGIQKELNSSSGDQNA